MPRHLRLPACPPARLRLRGLHAANCNCNCNNERI
jgi:hypothetical protein